MEEKTVFRNFDMEKVFAVLMKVYGEQEGVKITYELVRKDEIA